MRVNLRGRTVRAACACGVLVLAVAACSGPERWHKAGTGDGDWRRDVGECRARADRVARRSERREILAAGDPTMDRGNTLGRDMAIFEGARRRHGSVRDCLAARGYQPRQDGDDEE